MNYSTESNPVAGRRLPVRIVLSAIAAIAAVVAVAIWSPSAGATAAPAAAAQPLVPQFDLLHAERFRVGKPFRHVWRADQPLVQEGWLLVLAAADQEILRPRQSKEPVLYVGAQTADRINTGQDSGRLVVLVPGDFALAGTRVFLGSEALPEELQQPQITAELDAAIARGVPPLPAAGLANAVPGVAEFVDDFALRQRAIDLVEAHSPTEKDLIAGWRLPLVTPR